MEGTQMPFKRLPRIYFVRDAKGALSAYVYPYEAERGETVRSVAVPLEMEEQKTAWNALLQFDQVTQHSVIAEIFAAIAIAGFELGRAESFEERRKKK